MSDADGITQFDEIPGNTLRVSDRLLWARRDFIIREITPGVEGVAWLTLAEIRVGLIQENALQIPIVLNGSYRRARW